MSNVTRNPPTKAANTLRLLGLLTVTGILLLLWQLIPSTDPSGAQAMPKLEKVIAALGPSADWSTYLDALAVTLKEAMAGLGIGLLVGVVLGVLLGESRLLMRGLYPYALALQATPPIALAPLFIVWFGLGSVSKIWLVAAATLFPILVSTMSGVANSDPYRIQLARAYGASKRQIRRKIVFPALVVPVSAGLEISAVLSFLAAIAGEFISANAGIGVILQIYRREYQMAQIFAVLVILIVVGITIAGLVRLGRNVVLNRIPNE